MRILRLLVTCSCFTTWTSIASAQVITARRFPMDVAADRGFMEGIELRVRPNDVAALHAVDAVTLTDVLLPGGPAVEVELRRAKYDTRSMNIYRDGEHLGGASVLPECSSWSGRVRGEDGSNVFLSFSIYGSRGWMKTQGRMIHLLASPGPGNDWSTSTSRFIDESALAAHGVQDHRACGTDSLADAPHHESRSVRNARSELIETGLQPPLECTMAIETDFQLFQKFGDETALLVYLNQLLEAASDLYVEQVNTYLTVIYLGYHTTQDTALPNPDRWDVPDVGDGTVALLHEFTHDWEQYPVYLGLPHHPNPLNPRPAAAAGARLNHFLSGAALGGGVAAALPGICNHPFNYAVSTGIAEVLTSFPVTQGPFNWDFTLFTHETGHNFGSQHTHNFCPPLDTCATGPCNSTSVCMPGTIMSYCNQCPGGMSNVNPVFHEACVEVMRAETETCLPIYREGSSHCFGDGIDPLITATCPCSNFGEPGRGCANSNSLLGGAQLTAWGSVNPNTIVFTATGVPNNALCTFVRGTVNVPAGASFGDGIRCYAGTSLRFGSQSAGQNGNAPNTAQAPAVTQPAGVTRYYQAQYRNPSAGFCPPALFNLSNAWTLAW